MSQVFPTLSAHPDRNFPPKEDGLILITGSNGFIGAKVVENLLERGITRLRCFVRPSSQLDRLSRVLAKFPGSARVEIMSGDLLSRSSCEKAVEGVTTIYHLAAGFEKSFAGAYMNSALATRNLIEAFLTSGVSPKASRFVNVSSFAVYSNLELRRGGVMDENCPLEQAHQERFDPYGFGKLKQEEIVRHYGAEQNLPFVILRPGAVFGPGKKDLSGRIGFGTFGFFIQVGGGHLVPLSYVDNCAEAIVLAGITPGVDGETFNVVDDELLTARQFYRAYRRTVKPKFSLWIPYGLAYYFSVMWEKYSKWSKGQLPPVFNRRRCVAEWKKKRFSNQKLHDGLGWTPRVGSKEAMMCFLAQYER